MGENDDISKLVIMIVGVSAIALFAYLIFRERQNVQTQTNQLSQLSDLTNLEQKIMQLNEKVDRFSKNNIQQLSTDKESERKVVSLKAKPRSTQPRAEFFGML